MPYDSRTSTYTEVGGPSANSLEFTGKLLPSYTCVSDDISNTTIFWPISFPQIILELDNSV